MRDIDVAAFLVEARAPEWSAFRAHYPACRECSQEVASWMTLERSLRAAGNPGPHPSEEQILAYESDPNLASDARQTIAAHLAGCRSCRSELAVLRRFDFDALAATPAPAREPWSARIREALTSLASQVFGPLPRPVLALAVLLLLLVPAGLAVWRTLGDAGPLGTGIIPEAPQIAQPAPEAPEPEAVPLPETPPPTEFAQGEPMREEEAVSPRPGLERRREPETAPAPPAAPRAPQEELAPGRTLLAAREAPPPPAPEEPGHEPAPVPDGGRPIQLAALVPAASPRYEADPRVAGTPIRVASLVRGGGGLPELQVLAPEHVGLTLQATPTLYWFVSRRTERPVEFTLSDETSVEPLLDLRLPGPHEPGIHALSLREHGVRLQAGVTYRWFVALASEPGAAGEMMAGGAIRRIDADAALETRLASAEPAARAHVLAQAGLWYDAFGTLSDWLRREPGSERLKGHRATLLEQVDLPQVAAFAHGR